VRIVVAPNAFKGSLSAPEAATAIAEGIRVAVPDAELVLVPVADGGDGTVDALVAALEPLMRNPASATAMGKGGRARVLEKFSLAAEANRIAEIYRTLV